MIDTFRDSGRPTARSALSRRGFLGRTAGIGVAATAAGLAVGIPSCHVGGSRCNGTARIQ